MHEETQNKIQETGSGFKTTGGGFKYKIESKLFHKLFRSFILYLVIKKGERTLRLGDDFGSTSPPAVHHRWGSSAHTAWALSPGANTTWDTKNFKCRILNV